MGFAFEVKETDLLGRIGTLTVSGKRLETPYLFPVVHPVRQSVPFGELKAMGYGGLMTNAYILYARRREEALERSLHGLIGFDGVLMTDSGGYQVLEYGGLDVSASQIAEFQSSIGSDLAVTLDKPTGYSLSRAYSRETMVYSLRNAVSTMKEFGSSATTWVGPVQGGLFPDLLSESARGLVESGFRFLALGSPTQVMKNYKFAELVGMIAATRKAIDYAVPLHLFGAGHPLTMAMSVALGCDTFDSASYILFARQGRYMTDQGVQKLERLTYLPCSCPVCSRTSVGELLRLERPEAVNRLALHNLYLLRKEIEACKQAVAEGRLWDLVEARSAAHPALFRAFKLFAEQAKLLDPGTPALKERGLMLRGAADLLRPELAIASAGLRRAKKKRHSAATLQLSSEQAGSVKPKRQPRRRSEADLYRFHPALGVFPAELEFVYPFSQTVCADESVHPDSVKAAVEELKRLGYGRVDLVAVRKQRSGSGGARSRRRPKGASPSPR